MSQQEALMTPALLVVALLASASPEGRSPAADDLRRLNTRVAVQLAQVEPSAIAGHWRRGGGFAGGELYLFEDRVYIATEWGCVQPETIYDKGQWSLENGVVELKVDPDGTWGDRGRDRRYAVLQMKDGVRLFGLDHSLHFLEKHGRADPSAWLDAFALSRAETWKAGQGDRIKADLLKWAWSPSYFDDISADCPTKTKVEKSVAELVNRLGSPAPDVVQRAVNDLIRLGPPAVPSIVCRLDDRRAMHGELVSYPSNGWEARVHYEPEKVIDCLSTILMVMVPDGPSCDLTDDVTEASRASCLSVWREWSQK
jgi:hypothetical protein